MTKKLADAPSYPWIVVGLLWFVCFFNYADRLAIFSVFPVLEKEFHLSKTQLGIIGASFQWVYAAASPYAGTVGDKWPRKAVILGGLGVWSAITGFTALCTRYWQFVFVRGAEGLGEAFYFPASMAYISDYHKTKTRSRAVGWHQTSLYAGTIFGGALAGWMAQSYGWRAPFVILGVAGIVLSVVLRLLLANPPKEKSGAVETVPLAVFLREFFRTPTAVLIVVAFFGANVVNAVFLTWMPTFLKEKFHLDLAKAGLGATVFIQLACVVGALSGGAIADRWAARVPTGRIQLKAWAAFLGAPFIFLCGWTQTPWVLIGAMTLFGFCKGLYDANLTPAYYDVISPARRSTATGIMNLVGFVGAGLGSAAIGGAVDKGATMSQAIASTAVVYVFVAVVLFWTAATTARADIARLATEALPSTPPESESAGSEY